MPRPKSGRNVSEDKERDQVKSVEKQAPSSSSESFEEVMDVESDENGSEKKTPSNSNESFEEKMDVDTEENRSEKKWGSESEQAQHLQLCMKLAAENKINAKNAFGLHLIDIMRHLTLTGALTKDLQEASLSLAASTSIYACRIEALYKETVQFHSTLQTLAGKKSKRMQIAEEDKTDTEDDSPSDGKATKRLDKKQLKSRLTNENEVTHSVQSTTTSKQEPHENFAIINASFSSSRTSYKLLHNLEISSDGAKMDFTRPDKIVKLKEKSVFSPSSNVSLLRRFSRKIGPIKNFQLEDCVFEKVVEEAMEDSETSIFSTPRASKSPSHLSRNASQFFSEDIFMDDNLHFNDEGGVGLDVCESPEKNIKQNTDSSNSDEITSLEINCNVFVADLSHALKEVAGTINVDSALLPVDSVLKRMLDKNETTMMPPKTVKTKRTTRVKKDQPPFYNLNDQLSSFDDVHRLYSKGKNTLISLPDGERPDWELEQDDYASSDAEIDLCDQDLNKEIHEILNKTRCDHIKMFKTLFLKASEPKKVENSVRSTFFCVDTKELECHSALEHFENLTDRNESKEAEEMRISFKKMSLSEIPAEDRAFSLDDVFEPDADPFILDTTEDGEPNAEKSFMDDEELKKLMVEPPVMVRPPIIHFEKRETNVDTDKLKKVMYSIIEEHFAHSKDLGSITYFSKVYEALKKDKHFKISMQYAFVILLLLSNEKCFSLQSDAVEKNSIPDILICQDANEVY